MNRLKQFKGQATASEYVITFFIVVGVITGMTVFIQRLLQGRIKVSRDYMIDRVSTAHGNAIKAEYEPYYGYVVSNVERRGENNTELSVGGLTGIYKKVIDEKVETQSLGKQAPPEEAF